MKLKLNTIRETCIHSFREEPMRTFLLTIREDIRKWYGSISVEEIMSNPKLVAAIAEMEERLQQLLANAEA